MATNPDGTALPPVRVDAAARQRIGASLSTTGRRIAGLDDDPTDSQRCTSVAVVTVLDPVAVRPAMSRAHR